jgi:hypothetical protein
MLRALETLQLENDTRRIHSMSMNRKKFYRELMTIRFTAQRGWFDAWKNDGNQAHQSA